MNKKSSPAGGLPVAFRPLVALILGVASTGLVEAGDPPVPYDEAEVFVELNNTDKDLGIHSLIDGDAWEKLEIKSPDGKKLLKTKLSGSLKKQGLTD